MQRTPFALFEYIASEDLNNIGIFSQAGLDALTADAVGTGKFWADMGVTQASSTSVTVAAGRIYVDGVFYGIPDQDEILVNLGSNQPTGAKRIVAIVGFGNEIETNLKPRFIENQVTGLKVPQNLPTEVRRKVVIDKVAGAESSSPAKPTIEPGYVPIAWVTMGTTGIEGIEMATEFGLPSLERMSDRLDLIDIFVKNAGQQIETLRSDLAVTNQKIAKVSLPLINQTAKGLAELKDRLGDDDSMSLTGYDHFLDLTGSNTGGAGYKARVEEGLRMPWAADQAFVPSLLNPGDPKVRTMSGMVLPLFTEKLRLDIWGNDIAVSLASYQYANTSFEIFAGPRRRRRYGPSMIVTDSSEFWQSAKYGVNYLTQTFKKGAENWQVTDEWTEDGITYRRVEQYWDDKIQYQTQRFLEDSTAENGYVLAQSFLNAQAGWVTKIGLRFKEVDPAKAMKVYLVKAPKGVPDPEQTIAIGTILAGAAQASVVGDPVGVENVVAMTPAYLDPGERYAVMLVTQGSFQVSCRADNYLSNGSLFFSDVSAMVPDIGKDMNMRLYFAVFTTPYLEIDLTTLTLPGGVSDIDALFNEQSPAGTEIFLKFQKAGVWYTLDRNSGTNPLADLPNTLPFRIVFVGTTDVMPAVKLTDSRISLKRADDDFVHWSSVRNVGSSTTAIEIELELVNWNPAKHTLTTQINYGATTEGPDTTVDTTLPNGNVVRKMTFSPTATTTYSIKQTGVTTDVVDAFAVQSRYDQAA